MYKLFIFSAIIALTSAAPGDLGYGHHDGNYGHHTQLVAIKPVVAKAQVWNPWNQGSGWNPWQQQNNAWNPWQQNNAWNPWQQQSSAWNPWQQSGGWNPWNQGYGHGGHHQQTIVKVPVPVHQHHEPATSYAQVTSYKVHHIQPVVKAIVPTYAHDYGHHSYGHGYGYH